MSGTSSWSTPEQSPSSNTLLEPAPTISCPPKSTEISLCNTPAPDVSLDIDVLALSVKNKESVLRYKGEQARNFLNHADKVCYDTLLYSRALTPARVQFLTEWNPSTPPAEGTNGTDIGHFRQDVHRLLVRLIQNSNELPASVVISGDIKLDQVNGGSYSIIARGGYAHIYAGQLAGQRVAVKSLLAVEDTNHGVYAPYETETERTRVCRTMTLIGPRKYRR